MTVEMTKHKYPNGSDYAVISVDGHTIGKAEITENGYIPYGCRKPIVTLHACAKRILAGQINRNYKEAKRLEALMEAVNKEAHG